MLKITVLALMLAALPALAQKKYPPLYQGYCAWAVSQNCFYPSDPKAFAVHNGRLSLHANQDVSRKFNQDLDGYISKAEMNWPGLGSKAMKERK